MNHAVVSPEILEKFGAGAPIPFDDVNDRPITRVRSSMAWKMSTSLKSLMVSRTMLIMALLQSCRASA